MSDLFDKCNNFHDLKMLQESGLNPYFRPIEEVRGNTVYCDGRPMIMIGSNNYLGLAHDPRVLEAAKKAIDQYGSGCTGSRFLNGTLSIHEELEEALATFLQKESVLTFSTGFFANQAALVTLMQDGDLIFCDRENHASIIDGSQFSGAKIVPFAHNSMESLERRLKRAPESAGKLIIVDGVFSMSGDVTCLDQIVPLAQKYNARVYVDEAHSFGVFGPKGEGVAHHFNMNKETDLVMGTFSKSLGSMGGFLAGEKSVIDYVKYKARCFIFTASLAPAVAGGVLKALELMQQEPERIDALWKNTKKMHAGFKSLGFNIGITKSPIVPILVGSEKKAFLFSKLLFEEGIFTTPAIYPAVRYGEAMVRTSYMATHTDSELNRVLETFEKISKKLGIFEDEAYKSGARKVGGTYDFSSKLTEVPMSSASNA